MAALAGVGYDRVEGVPKRVPGVEPPNFSAQQPQNGAAAQIQC